jgi:hypothetical protein
MQIQSSTIPSIQKRWILFRDYSLVKPAGVITRAESVSVWERQIAFKLAEMFGGLRFEASLSEASGTAPRTGLIASCCGKAGYGDAFAGAQSWAQKITPGSKLFRHRGLSGGGRI